MLYSKCIKWVLPHIILVIINSGVPPPRNFGYKSEGYNSGTSPPHNFGYKVRILIYGE